MADVKRVYLCVPYGADDELVRKRLCNIKTTLEEAGYSVTEPPGTTAGQSMETALMMRLSLLVVCSAGWFPCDFQRSAVSVAEYNYAYAMNKKIEVDPARRLLD